jgi:hypothetical protein
VSDHRWFHKLVGIGLAGMLAAATGELQLTRAYATGAPAACAAPRVALARYAQDQQPEELPWDDETAPRPGITIEFGKPVPVSGPTQEGGAPTEEGSGTSEQQPGRIEMPEQGVGASATVRAKLLVQRRAGQIEQDVAKLKASVSKGIREDIIEKDWGAAVSKAAKTYADCIQAALAKAQQETDQVVVWEMCDCYKNYLAAITGQRWLGVAGSSPWVAEAERRVDTYQLDAFKLVDQLYNEDEGYAAARGKGVLAEVQLVMNLSTDEVGPVQASANLEANRLRDQIRKDAAELRTNDVGGLRSAIEAMLDQPQIAACSGPG